MAFLVLFLALVTFISCNLLAPDTDPRIENMRKKGYPVSLAELDAWYAKLPASDNAALQYQNAFSTLSGSREIAEMFTAKKARARRKEGLSPAEREELEDIVKTNRATLELLRAVPPRPSRYPIDLTLGYATLLPHLAKLREAVALLCAESLWRAGKGENDEALQSLVAAARLADSLKEEPTLVSQMVRIASVSMLLSCVEQVLGATHLSDTQLASLQGTLVSCENPKALSRALGGEQAFGLAVFTEPRQQLGMFAGGTGNSGRSSSDLFRVRLVVGLAKATGIVRKDRNFFLGAMATNIAAAELSYPQRLEAGRRAGVFVPPSRFYFISSMLLPALSRAIERDADLTAQVRAAMSALAIERYRLAHQGALPENLAALAPAFMTSVPLDPYDGQPLRFKRLAKGYVVYSIGSDGRDDGGLEADPNNRNAGHDVTFTVEH